MKQKEMSCATLAEVGRKYPKAPATREAGRRARAEACPLLTAEPRSTAAEVRSLFADLADHPVLILAVSGGPDSTALLVLAARWRKALKRGPKLVAVTVDHGLRPEARREAAAVKRLARSLGVAHRTLRWSGRKPTTGLQEAARLARYRLLADAARKAGGPARAHRSHARRPGRDRADPARPRQRRRRPRRHGARRAAARRRRRDCAGAAAARGAEGAADRDASQGRHRPMPTIRATAIRASPARGCGPRCRRWSARGSSADAAGAAGAPGAAGRGGAGGAWSTRAADARAAPWPEPARSRFRRPALHDCRPKSRCGCSAAPSPAAGNEGPVELGKLEALHAGLAASPDAARFRRTLAGAVVTRSGDRLTVERAPARRGRTAAPKRP